MCKIEDKYREVVGKIEESKDKKEIKKLKIQGLYSVFRVFNSYLNQDIQFCIAFGVLEKRLENLLSVHSKEDIEEVLKLNFTRVENNEFVEGKYYIPEEELILLYSASQNGRLNPLAQGRLQYLLSVCNKGVVS